MNPQNMLRYHSAQYRTPRNIIVFGWVIFSCNKNLRQNKVISVPSIIIVPVVFHNLCGYVVRLLISDCLLIQKSQEGSNNQAQSKIKSLTT